MHIGDPNPKMSASLEKSMSDYVSESITIYVLILDVRIKQNNTYNGRTMCLLDSP